VVVVEARERVHREVGVSVESCVETTTDVTAPVTIDVEWLALSDTSLFIIGSSVADAVSCEVNASPCKDTLLMLHTECVEVQVDVVGDGWLQARITLGDVQWVGVVLDVQQVGHAWLLSTSAITQTQVGLLGEVIAEVNIWRK